MIVPNRPLRPNEIAPIIYMSRAPKSPIRPIDKLAPLRLGTTQMVRLERGGIALVNLTALVKL